MLRLVVLIAFAWATPAIAKPTVAIAPFIGDGDDEITDVIVEVVGESAKVVKPKEVVKAIGKLGISGELDAKDAQRLQKSLKADAVLQGRVRQDGKNKKLKLTVYVKGKKPGVFTVEFKNPSSDKLRDGVREQLAKRIDIEGEDDEEEEERRKKKQRDDEEEAERARLAEAEEKRGKKQREDDEEREREKERENERKKKKRLADEDEDNKKKKRRSRDDDDDDKKRRVSSRDDDDDGERKVRKKKRRDDEDDTEEAAVARVMVRVDAGTSLGVRRLTYTGENSPPRVGTFGFGARVEGELYPFASKPGGAGGIGIAAEYDKTLGLAIQVPGGAKAPIDQQHFSIGARYRIGGAKSFAFGVDFAKRKYVADRSQLVQPTDLDAPDVDYTAVAPGAALRIPAGSKAAVFGNVAALLILDTGPIQDRTQYGAATVYGVELGGGLDIALAKSFALRLAGEVTQISFKFKGNGAQAMTRGVTAATDRTFGMAATLAMTY